MDQARSLWGARLKGRLKVKLFETGKNRGHLWACAAIDVEDADTELELALGVGTLGGSSDCRMLGATRTAPQPVRAECASSERR
jgi:hypothetical protein